METLQETKSSDSMEVSLYIDSVLHLDKCKVLTINAIALTKKASKCQLYT